MHIENDSLFFYRSFIYIDTYDIDNKNRLCRENERERERKIVNEHNSNSARLLSSPISAYFFLLNNSSNQLYYSLM